MEGLRRMPIDHVDVHNFPILEEDFLANQLRVQPIKERADGCVLYVYLLRLLENISNLDR